MKRKSGGGNAPKHKGTSKHRQATAKHSQPTGAPGHGITPVQGGSAPAVVARHPSHPKPRKLALGDMVACCAAEALAASLRLSGAGASDDDLLKLYFSTAAGPDDGAAIADTLRAAAEFGLAGARPSIASNWRESINPASSLILGIGLPEGPHAVLATSDGWWSWGELYDPASFPGAVIEETWAVTWA